MSRFAILNDYHEYAEMIAAPMRAAGHDVLLATSPIDWERVVQFGPEAVSVGLYRKREAFNRPVLDWESDVLGVATLHDIAAYPAIQVLPICLVGSALERSDVPTSVRHDLFLSLPEDIQGYLPKMEALTRKPKTRRKLSGYVCSRCGGRMVAHKQPAMELFCPRCHTAVSVIDDVDGLMLVNGFGPAIPCKLADLQPAPPDLSSGSPAPPG